MDGRRLRDLMLRSLAGEAAAYREFLGVLADGLRPWLRRRLFAGPDQAEDILQEVLMAVHTKRHTYDPAQPVTAWLFAIARYKLVDHLRRQKRRGGHVDLDSVGEMPGEQSGTDGVEEGAVRSDMARLLARLPPKQRRAIELVKLQQMSVREASVAASMSESDIKISVHRGLKTLARLVAEDDPS